tara:strand:- start:2182 stop:2868 length:687 start_codon:yes stop_codon:yes gene_type:complete
MKAAKDAKGRFELLVKAINDKSNQQADLFRKNVLAAYGCDDQSSSGKWEPDELARKEKEFAERCLSGRGPDEIEATLDQGNLCTVLAKEIGTQTERYQMMPWLGGDWITMANLIIHNSKIALAGSDDEKPKDRVDEPLEIIRLWPVLGTVGEPVSLPSEGTHRIQLKIGIDGCEETISLQTGERRYFDYEWIMLAEAPRKLHNLSTKESGVPSNLWKGFEWDPGDRPH